MSPLNLPETLILVFVSTVFGWFLWWIRPRPPEATAIADAEHEEWAKRQVSPVRVALQFITLYRMPPGSVDTASFERVAALRGTVDQAEIHRIQEESLSLVDLLDNLAKKGDFVLSHRDGIMRAYLPEEWPCPKQQ